MKKEIWDAIAGIDERFILEAAEVQRQAAGKQCLPESGNEKVRATTRRWSWGKAAVIVFCLGLTAAGVALLLRLAPLSSSGQTPGTVISPITTLPITPSNETEQDSHTVETADDAFEAEIQAALEAKQPKQIWAADFFPEIREEVPILRFTASDCTALYPELIELLFPDATVTKKSGSPDGVFQVQLKQGRTSIRCTCDTSSIIISGLPSKQMKELFPKAADWVVEKTGSELHEWTGYDRYRLPAYLVYTESAGGLAIGAMKNSQLTGRLHPGHGIELDNATLTISLPISVGEAVGTVRLFDQFSPEELRMNAEFMFSADAPVIEVYRSCELCYLIHEEKGLLIPVFWVKGTRYDYERGTETAFEMVFDAETGSVYELGGY